MVQAAMRARGAARFFARRHVRITSSSTAAVPPRFNPDATNNSKSEKNEWISAAAAGTAAFLGSYSLMDDGSCKRSFVLVSSCEEPQEDDAHNDVRGIFTESNPLWPAVSISDDDIDTLVEDILADPDINIKGIPDVIEREIYRSTIKLFWHAVYYTMSGFHGLDVGGGHVIQLTRQSVKDVDRSRASGGAGEAIAFIQRRISARHTEIDQLALQAVADRMLANPAINQPYLPDFLERQIYVNCIKIIFRLLDIVAACVRMTVCGHDVSMSIEKSQQQRAVNEQIREVAIKSAKSSATRIDIARIRGFADQVGIRDRDVDRHRGYWERLTGAASYENMMANIHATLYAMILGILDDLLANTSFELFSDRIAMDIVASPSNSRSIESEDTAVENVDLRSDANSEAADRSIPRDVGRDDKPSVLVVPVAFTAGVTVGVILMALLGKR